MKSEGDVVVIKYMVPLNNYLLEFSYLNWELWVEVHAETTLGIQLNLVILTQIVLSCKESRAEDKLIKIVISMHVGLTK